MCTLSLPYSFFFDKNPEIEELIRILMAFFDVQHARSSASITRDTQHLVIA
jgi:hypothetical protein